MPGLLEKRSLRPLEGREAIAIFELNERDIGPGCREIKLDGELDLAVSEKLRAALERVAERDLNALLDFSACEFIDVSGVSILVRSGERLSSRGRQLLLRGASGQVWRMLSVTGLAGAEHGDDERRRYMAKPSSSEATSAVGVP